MLFDNVVVLLTEGHGGDSDGEEDEAGHGGGHGGLGAAHQATQRGSGQGTRGLDTGQWTCE